MEKQEEERKKSLKEQEERDLEMARKLDLELNLDPSGEGSAPRETVLSGAQGATRMPGGW